MTSQHNTPDPFGKVSDRESLRPRTIVYIDGFNFYYGAVRRTALKWLDYRALSGLLLPNHQIDGIKYFTARVIDDPDAPGAAQRQDDYIRALEAHSVVEVHYGKFTSHVAKRRLATGPEKGTEVKVVEQREKGSDVSLGSHLVRDSCRAAMDVALVMSNDSDLQTPIMMAEKEGVTVVTVNPSEPSDQPRRRHLHSSQSRQLTMGRLKRSQLPNPVVDRWGEEIPKPVAWS